MHCEAMINLVWPTLQQIKRCGRQQTKIGPIAADADAAAGTFLTNNCLSFVL